MHELQISHHSPVASYSKNSAGFKEIGIGNVNLITCAHILTMNCSWLYVFTGDIFSSSCFFSSSQMVLKTTIAHPCALINLGKVEMCGKLQ